MVVKPRRRSSRSFYSDVVTDAERSQIPAALEVDGVDAELALLRVRLRTALAKEPQDLPLIFKGIELLAKLVAMRYRLPKAEAEQMKQTMGEAFLAEVAHMVPKHGDD